MRLTLSAAVTADGYLDNCNPERLIVSTPEDWAAVHALRADHDAILVGAETLRCDDPALVLRDPQARRARIEKGLRPDPAKVTLTRSGRLSPGLRFFTQGEADRYVFSTHELPELSSVATVISSKGKPLTARFVVTELEKRGIGRLFVEGGSRILGLFLSERMADTLRLAVNPALRLDPGRGRARFEPRLPADTPCREERLGGMVVRTWTLHPDTTEEDLAYLRLAISESRRCTPAPTSYRVGAVVVAADGRVFRGYTHETSPTRHAEQEAVTKALQAGAELRGAAIYSSMEPCSTRASEPESCSQLILRHGFSRVVFALYEPDRFVCCRGALLLREAGVDVRAYPSLGEEVLAVNAHLWR